MTRSAEDYRDARLPAGARAELLLREMTLEAKASQLTSLISWSLIRTDGSDAPEADKILRHPPGHVSGLIVDDPAKLVFLVGLIQKQVLARTRLAIPVLFHQEALSGFLVGGHMVFPAGTGLAATVSTPRPSGFHPARRQTAPGGFLREARGPRRRRAVGTVPAFRSRAGGVEFLRRRDYLGFLSEVAGQPLEGLSGTSGK